MVDTDGKSAMFPFQSHGSSRLILLAFVSEGKLWIFQREAYTVDLIVSYLFFNVAVEKKTKCSDQA